MLGLLVSFSCAYCCGGANKNNNNDKSNLWYFASFVIITTPIFLLTTLLMFGSSTTSLHPWLSPLLSTRKHHNISECDVFSEESERRFISSIMDDLNFCQQFYKTFDANGEFVCWWLHLEKDDADANRTKVLVKKQWLLEDGNGNNKNVTARIVKQRRNLFLAFIRKHALRYYFRPRLSRSDRQLMLNLTRMCLSVVENLYLPYFLFAGSLLGYIRHNGSVIPWDDDVDLGLLVHRPDQIPFIAKQLQQKAMEMYGGAIKMYYVPNELKMKRVKCFGTVAPALTIDGYDWRFPFIDIQFMRFRRSGLIHIDKFIQDMSLIYENYPYNDVFPLKRVNFSEENVPVYVPNNPINAVHVNFKNIAQCQSPSYNHRIERPYHRFVKIDCSELSPLIDNF